MKCSKCQFDNPAATNFCGKCGVPLTAEARMADSLTKTLTTPLPVIAKDKLIAGKYRIIEEIGQGGMGIVYKAEDLQLQRCVALKFLPPHLTDSRELRERFLIEARAAAALSHPNICVIHEVGASEERPYIAMEYVEGEPLRDKIKQGPLKPEEALDYAVQIAAGLGEAHGKGIIHRDVKSANIMVTKKGQAKVMDFGLAKLRGGSSLTKSQTTLGTVAYMSPEQARGEELDHRTDLWSLGVVLYEMLAGELPFKGDHDQTVIHEILHREPKRLDKIRPGLPPGLEKIAFHALTKYPDGRYQTMEDLRNDLEAVAEGLKPLKARRRIRKTILGLNPAFLLRGALGAIIVLFGLNAGGFRDRVLGRKGGSEPAIRLAVLPFANLSGDPEQEFLADGITQEMITQLGRLHPQALSVIARTSVMRYKKGDTSVDQIGRELNVNYVLEGSLRREAARVRINAELIRVGDRTQAWAGTYEPELSGILAAQGQVAKGVAKALAVKLLPAEEARLAVVRTVNSEAYEAYLKGSSLWQTMKQADCDAARRYFELALEKDPNYAPAFAGLAWVWMASQQMGFVPQSEGVPKAKEAALQAVALDENSAEGHEALATVLTWGEWDWGGAEAEWQRALELNPNGANAQAYYAHFLAQMGFVPQSEGVPKAKEAALQAVALDENSAEGHEALATVLTWGEWDWGGAETEWQRALELNPNGANAQAYYAHFLAHMGRAAEGLRHSDLAVKLDPFNALYHALRSIVLLYLKRPDDAIAAARGAIAIRADMSIAYVAMLRAYMAKGMRDEHLADQRLRISRDPERVAAFERGLAEGGYEGAQRGIADVLAARYEKSQDATVSVFGIALRYLDAGDNDRAIAWLQKAYDVHDSDLPYVNSPPWDRLRDDLRYQALLRRIGLPLGK